MARPSITMEYFRGKMGAVDLIDLVDYLNKKEVKDEHLINEEIVKLILRHGMRTTANANLDDSEIDEFKETILNFKIDYWKKTNLYRINHAILLVACVEHILAPNTDDYRLMKMYRCDKPTAERLYKGLLRLCGITKEDNLNPVVIKSAQTFFRCSMFSEVSGFLETIRSYLKTININDEEKIYIRNTSIQLIDNTETINYLPLQTSNDTEAIDTLSPKENNDTETIDTVPLQRSDDIETIDTVPLQRSDDIETIDTVPLQRSDDTETINTRRLRRCIINQEYFQKKSKAHVIINLVNYLKKNKIEKENLQEKKILIEILRNGMKKFVDAEPSEKQLRPFKQLLTSRIDMWKAAHLYRINHGILAVACVEHVLYPGKGDEEYKKIYGGDYQKATELYKELCDIPEEDQIDPAIVKSAASFFQCTNKCLESIRPYLGKIYIDFEEIEHIKNASIELIKSNKDKLSTNMMDPIEYRTINVPIDEEQLNPPMIQIIYPDMQSLNVDPPPVVSIPVDQGLIKSNENKPPTMMDPIEYHTINVPIDDEQPHSNMIQIIYPDLQSLNVDPTSVVSIPIGQGLIKSNEDEPPTNMMDPIEDYPINVTIDDEQPHPNMIQIIYSDLQSLNFEDPSVVSIPVDQGLIKSNEDEPPTNIMDPIEDYPINVTIDDEQTPPPMPDVPSVNVDPPLVVSIPVDQGSIKNNEDEPPTNMMDPIEDYPINVTIDDEQTPPPMPDVPSVNVDPPFVVSIPVDHGSIKSNEDESPTNMMDPVEDHPINVPIDDEPGSPPTDVPTIKVYLPSTNMIDLIDDYPIFLLSDDEHGSSPTPNVSEVKLFSKVSIPVNQGLLKSNEDKPPTNIMNLIEDQPSTSSVVSSENLNSSSLIDELVANLPHNVSDFIDNQAENLTTIDKLPLPSTLDVSSVNVDPSSVVSSPSVNQ